MFVILVGPKGSGKSHIGRLLEKHLDVTFFHVEPLWMAYHAECAAEGRRPDILEGISRVHPHVAEALERSPSVCVETTGASPEIFADLLSLEDRSRTLVACVSAPLRLCLERIENRDQTNQIPMDSESVREIHALSSAAVVESELTIENVELTDSEIVDAFESAIAIR